MSQMNQGFGSQAPGSGRPGQMTAVMRAMQQATGPKVLRIGLVAAGRILEERIVKQRTSVTVGPSEKSTFVVQANLPVQFKLFELIGGDYYLNFLDGMTGRIALATGITDLVALKGQAKRVGPAYQVRLTEEARGKIVIGEITFLFQFVAPPPVQPRPQLPLSVKGGLASQIDWSLTIIAAFSFLLHFGLVGAMYSDWMDPVVNDDLTAGLLDMVQRTVPPPTETAEEVPTASATTTDTAPAPTQAPKASTAAKSSSAAAPDAKVVAGLMNEADQARIAILAALNGGANIKGAMNDDNGAPVDLNSLANRSGGFTNSNSLVSGVGGGGPIQPGKSGGGLQDPARGQHRRGVHHGRASDEGRARGRRAVRRLADERPGPERRGRHPQPDPPWREALLPEGPGVRPDAVGQARHPHQGRAERRGRLGERVEQYRSLGLGGRLHRRSRAPSQVRSPGANGSTISVPFNFVKQGG